MRTRNGFLGVCLGMGISCASPAVEHGSEPPETPHPSVTTLAPPQSPQEAKAARLDATVQHYVKHGMFSGSVLVAEAGEGIYSAGYGFADLEWSVPHTPGSRFILASLSKPITAIAVMRLVEQGKLSLDHTIAQHLPDYPAEAASRITVRQLLTHRAGLPHYADLPGWFDGEFRKKTSLPDFLAFIARQPLLFEPGTASRYSNSGYLVLATIMEKVTGQAYADIIETLVFKPAGMTHSGEADPVQLRPHQAKDYVLAPGGGYQHSGYVDISLFKGGGSLYSTVGDLFALDRALHGDTLLSAASKALVFHPERPFGWVVGQMQLDADGPPVAMIRYNGSINGYNSMMTRLVDDQHLIVLLNNTGVGYNVLSALSRELAAVVYERPLLPTKPRLSFMLTQAATHSNLAEGIAQFRASPHDYEIDEIGINSLGYRFLESGATEQAVKLLELGCELLPSSANLKDSLGEFYRAAGQFEKARQSYEASLQLDPSNDNARRALAELVL